MAKFMALKKNSGFNHRLFCCLLHLTKQPPCFGKFVWKPFILLFSSLENLWIFQTSSNPVWRTWDGRRDSMKTWETLKKGLGRLCFCALCLSLPHISPCSLLYWISRHHCRLNICSYIGWNVFVNSTNSTTNIETAALSLDFSMRPIFWEKKPAHNHSWKFSAKSSSHYFQADASTCCQGVQCKADAGARLVVNPTQTQDYASEL